MMLHELPPQPSLSPSSSSISIQAPSMTGIDLEEFHLFGCLPAELRIKIWHFALPRNRVVTLNFVVKKDGVHFSIPQSIPAILHVNTESRLEALRVYQLAFHSYPSAPMFYVDFTTDIFWVGLERTRHNRVDFLCLDDIFYFLSKSADFDKIQRLVVAKRTNIFPGGQSGFESWLEHIKELMVEIPKTRCTTWCQYQSPWEYAAQNLMESPSVEWVEEAEDDHQENDIIKSFCEEVKRDITTAKERTPSWTVPALRFGKMKAMSAGHAA